VPAAFLIAPTHQSCTSVQVFSSSCRKIGASSAVTPGRCCVGGGGGGGQHRPLSSGHRGGGGGVVSCRLAPALQVHTGRGGWGGAQCKLRQGWV
jgi:hypothetical protein